MKISRIQLLVACAASSFVASAANAQVAIPAVELRGAGATTVGDVVVRSLNCIGNPGAGLNQYGTNSNQLLTIAPGNYAPTTPTATNPARDCATQEIQPAFEGKYIGTGSGGGRQIWRTFATNPPLTGAAGNQNPFGTWTNTQFAFSEAVTSVSDLAAYNAGAGNATNGAGAAIQVPFYVIPIAFAYNPVYGKNGAADMTFNVKVPASINGVVSGGLRLNRSAYCKIFNGEITNWNDAALKTLNSNLSLHDTTDDTLARWTAEGAPIRLIGRADRSGGSDVFTRAMAAQCDPFVTTNKFDRNAESLPYNNTSTIDIRNLRPDTHYFPTSSSSRFSGPVQSLGGLVYDRVTDNICLWSEVSPTTARCDVTLAPGGVFTNTPTPGLFTVSDGSSGVAEAIETTVNNAMINSTTAGITLNGKFGYIGADFVKPVAGRNLFSAAVQAGALPSYVMPSSLNASAAFGTILPPQSTAGSGAYSLLDTRTLGSTDPYLIIDPVTNPATPINRANPLHWAAALYNPNVPITSTLAAPAKGYPVTGVAFMLTYTCFKPANSAVPGNNANRFGIVQYMASTFGKITKSSVNTFVSPNTFKGPGATSIGILSQSNTAVPSAGWQNAITDTFLKKGPGALGLLNLWIQDNYPTTALDVDGLVQATDQKSNPGCDPTKGA
ncbi:substrate-binding domain-containing protein [Sphingorhabdus sp.]|uniref:substrate-binding domain-containing protein n=1 Tax=Sphingorhabdus sp. TaxID=1902408 RepID=UPI003593437B